jgi:hypothetical protein
MYGTKRNMPVTHTGNIALVPGSERIPTERGDVEGYLVQANPISGCSGAPVWASAPLMIEPGNPEQIFYAHGKVFLLGIWIASWKVRGSEIVTAPSDDAENERRAEAPLGMGIVISTNKMIDIFTKIGVAN